MVPDTIHHLLPPHHGEKIVKGFTSAGKPLEPLYEESQ